MKEVHVVDGWQTSVTPLTAPDGSQAEVIELTFMTRSALEQTEFRAWPTLRLPPNHALLLIEKLQLALSQLGKKGADLGPGQVH